MAVGLRVLPEQAPTLRAGVCPKLELRLCGSPGVRAVPAVPPG